VFVHKLAIYTCVFTEYIFITTSCHYTKYLVKLNFFKLKKIKMQTGSPSEPPNVRFPCLPPETLEENGLWAEMLALLLLHR
jgi:hypothetical protein